MTSKKDKRDLRVRNKAFKAKVLEQIDGQMPAGIGTEGHACVMASIAIAAGEGLTDEPKCVHELVREFGITLNDSAAWGSDQARVKDFALAALGTRKLPTKAVEYGLQIVQFAAIVERLESAGNMALAEAIRTEKDPKALQRLVSFAESDLPQSDLEFYDLEAILAAGNLTVHTAAAAGVYAIDSVAVGRVPTVAGALKAAGL